MSAATSRRPPRLARRLTRLSRSERMAKLLTKYDFASFCSPVRVVPDAEALYFAIVPMALRAPDRFVGGAMVSYNETMRMRARAYALRIWLARRLARLAIHEGLAAAWRASARDDLYRWRLCRREAGR